MDFENGGAAAARVGCALPGSASPGAVCPVCGKAFRWPQGMWNHMELHRGLTACAVCGAWYVGKPCALCGRPFFSRSSFKQHKALHRGETTCHVCGKVFGQKLGLKRHFRRVHALEL
ncbi:zinc finger protein 728-like [Pollicipes pollicipes]|uniref:zinc finger protein 728-like n=1 Tax=Pollicipes pollicipes TaxID=41117 RepID=UPI001884D32F|nr:zinc finger protein 728-like [Pollicipes pollicipes]